MLRREQLLPSMRWIMLKFVNNLYCVGETVLHVLLRHHTCLESETAPAYISHEGNKLTGLTTRAAHVLALQN